MEKEPNKTLVLTAVVVVSSILSVTLIHYPVSPLSAVGIASTSSQIMSQSLPQIDETDFGDGDRAFTALLPVPPFGSALFASPDLSKTSRDLLADLIRRWESLWPEMLAKMQEGIEDYGTGQKLGSDEFMGAVSAMEKDDYMGDRCDVHVRIEFNEPPLWDYFLKGSEIVHWQAVF